MNRYLLISRVGPESLHRDWLSPASERNFDVLLSSYAETPDLPEGDGIWSEFRPGPKTQGYAALFQAHAERIARYDFVALFDDDLIVSADGISRMFDICAAHDLKIAQPSLSHDSYFSYAGLLQQPRFKLRHVTFIEMMAPIFRRDVLQEVIPLYSLGFEVGIDLIWCNQTFTGPEDFAVLDACPVRHAKRVGAAKATNGFPDGRVYEDDIHAILNVFQIPWVPCVPYDAIAVDGAKVTSRTRLMRSAFDLAKALPRPPGDAGRLRKIVTHWKHLATVTPANVKPVAP